MNEPETLSAERGADSGAATGSLARSERCEDRTHLSLTAQAGDMIGIDAYDTGETVVIIKRGERTEIHELGIPENAALCHPADGDGGAQKELSK